MAKRDFLNFDIDPQEIKAIQKILGANEEQVRKAHNRALSRTAVTMKSLGTKLVRDEMKVKSLKALRQRFQTFRVSSKNKKQLDELRLWFGLNDVRLSDLKGRIARIGSKKKPKGAKFTPAGSGDVTTYDDAFVAKVRGRRSIWARKGKRRYPIGEKKVAINDRTQVLIEDEVFSQLPEVYLKHFETDLKGRIKMAK